MRGLTAEEIIAQTAHREQTVIVLDRVDSTNTHLKALAQSGAPDGTAVLAEEQTAGRGRLGRSFQSVRGKGLYLSYLWRTKRPCAELLPLTGLCAVAVCRAVERACGLRVQIKWTNDLIVRERKLGGILTELLSVSPEETCAVIGVGLNVCQTAEDFFGEVRSLATSLAIEGQTVRRETLAAALIDELHRLPEMLSAPEEALAAYRHDCVTLGREVRLLWRDTQETVRAEDIDEQFGLIVRHKDGTVETVRTGEASVRGFYGYTE